MVVVEEGLDEAAVVYGVVVGVVVLVVFTWIAAVAAVAVLVIQAAGAVYISRVETRKSCDTLCQARGV